MYKKPGNEPFHSLYRWVIRQDTNGNPLAALLFTRAGRNGIELVEHRSGLKPVFKWLRSGGVFYYLPDQDLGRRQAVFAPFFGVEAATVAAVDRFVRATDAVVLPSVTLLGEDGRFTVEVGEPMAADWHTPEEFAARMNEMIEKQVYAHPEQYFWLHKRFKTRPPGAPPVYR